MNRILRSLLTPGILFIVSLLFAQTPKNTEPTKVQQPERNLQIKTKETKDIQNRYEYYRQKKLKNEKPRPIIETELNQELDNVNGVETHQEPKSNQPPGQIESIETEDKVNSNEKPGYKPPIRVDDTEMGKFKIPDAIKMDEITVDYSADHVPDQILVLIKGVDISSNVLEEIKDEYKFENVEYHKLSSINATLAIIAVPDKDLKTVIADIVANSNVLLAQPNYYYSSLGNETLQYGVHKIKADVAHKKTTGKGIKVAVIDTGVDYNHEVLKDKIVMKEDFVNNDPNDFTSDIHGTSVAGIIAARADTSGKIIGIAPDVNIIAAKACWYEKNNSLATCTTDKIAKAVNFAILKKANVMNLSLGGPQDILITALINKALEEGTVVVAASGNSGSEGKPVYPAALEQVIAVSATDSKDKIYKFSTIGDYVDLSAPGVDILSPAPDNKWQFQSGTSFAAAHVTGAVALLMQMHPELLPFQIRFVLGKSSVDLGEPGKDKKYGDGRIDVARALQELELN